MTPLDEAIEDELYFTASRLGIKQADARDAIERVEDKRDLLRRWKRTLQTAERRILAADERKWANDNALVAAERHTELQREQSESRRAARERMTLGRRLDALRAETVTEPGPGVSQLGTTKIKGGESDGAPPDPAQFRTRLDMTLSAHWLWILRHIEMLEDDWDEFLGRGASRSWVTATADEKDREILTRYVGVHSREVAVIAPYLGSRRTIEGVRSRHKLKPTTGEPK